ncbi:UDP-N-acetylmuramoyl-L-alanyl-D-glutamate--2,6-diaminopimelate ligase [Cocleimonas flava]|uniref:UDP-N-acetylmuramoyl-L-alanyl-D-glutamate--2,6-diaminopimelate ligase n=1 Tax=Cocleimonas flava TaxID=634765 RepID=A0A4R1F6W1_9GAMM|nr:UDP-N-acetylmuramoyl-L-alanyl-D-glutamate--2,6-diaminopimelate ligase [Cocleimonas flava]TCJ88314.1 UDP-N-acetylmuramoylalanyl-D-glutamate--2,6-diaminopimelate ligase [Cocleimonas flava]
MNKLFPTKLSVLLEGIAQVTPALECDITSITLDSREAKAGTLFVALKGTQQHGLNYANDVAKQGASAIVWEKDGITESSELNIPQFEITNLRDFLGEISNRFFGSVSESLNMIGITGTDGKTSVSHFIAQAMNDSAVIGTLGIGSLDDLQTATHTTPDVFSVHESLVALKAKNIKTVAMEVSSHALDQGRVAGVAFDVAVLTNLSRDHLDYHKTLEAYAEAKEKLFDWAGLKAIVVNLDDKFGRKMALKSGGVIAYGVGQLTDYPEGSLVAVNAKFTHKGISADIHFAGKQAKLNASVLGRFNLSNLLAALGAMLALGDSLESALARLNHVETVAGRMEKVADSDVLAVVDYAHTPNALETVLKALREHTENNLICVFGCGGDRDAGKRPMMAQIAEANADVVIVTDDNPRTENPELIMKDIVAGFINPSAAVIEHDRASAISKALTQAKRGDTVLIAGKGHEKVQILATGSIPFSDREHANKVLLELAA